MSTYRYLFADLLTNSIIGELPLTNVNFTQALNSAGTLSGQLLLSGVNSNALNVSASTIPARCALYVDRDGVLVWGGIIWSRSYMSSNQTLAITAREFESYLERRRISSTVTFASQDQLTVASNLVGLCQSAPYSNIGIQVPSNTSGILTTRTYFNYDLKSYYDAILDLSRSSTGFDFAINVAYDGSGNPTKNLVLGYPRIGTAYSASNASAPVFEFPAGNIIEYSYPEDGSLAANQLWVRGGGAQTLAQVATDTSKTAAGWPLLEDYATYADVLDTTTLSNLAAGYLTAYSYPPVTLQIVVPPYVNPVLGSYIVGDDCRIRIRDERFPTGLDATYRITALNVTAGENGPERATLTLTLPTS